MSPKIKVAHVVTLLELGGAQQNTLYTVQNLARERYEPFLICGRGAYLDREAKDLGVPVYFVDTLDRPVRPLRDLLALLEITWVLKREKPDVVHTHSSKAGILGRWAARMAGVGVVVHTYHGFGFNREQRFWSRWLFALAEKITAPLTRALIFVSRANREEAQRRGIGKPEQYQLIRSGVSLGLYKTLSRRPNAPEDLSLSTEHKLVTTIGPFKPQKNMLDFIRAAALVRKRHPEARFLMVGDGALRPRLSSEIHSLRLDDVFFLPGWRRDIPIIFMRTNVFVMTSLWEGLPRALVEAMAAGLPCVANAVDGVADVIQDGVTGLLTTPRRVDQTAEKIIQLLDKPPLAIEMGHRARESLGEEFDIDFMVRRQEKLYAELTGVPVDR